VPLL
jgi:ATP-dependent DNA ligase